MTINQSNCLFNDDLFIVCCSTNKKNEIDNLLTIQLEANDYINLDSLFPKNYSVTELIEKLDFDYALTINGKLKYSLTKKQHLPVYGECKNATMFAQTYWQHPNEAREQNGMQNLTTSVKLMMECLTCAEAQKLNIHHCQCIEAICNTKNNKTEHSYRVLSLVIKKQKNGLYDRDTQFMYGEFTY